MTKIEQINPVNYSYKYQNLAKKNDSISFKKITEPCYNFIHSKKSPKFKTLTVASVIALIAGITGFFSGKNNKNNVEETLPTPVEQINAEPMALPQFAEQEEEENQFYVVKENDNIWNISKSKLQNEGESKPKNNEINNLKNEVIKMNPQVKNGGNLIHKGDTLILPVSE